jgi:predicted permease
MGLLIQDMRLGFRMLRKSGAFTLVAILTLAVGIGANVAIFSYVDGLWLRPLPIPHADRVVRLFTSNPSSHGPVERGYSSYPDFEDVRAGVNSLSGVALLQRRGAMFDDGEKNRLVTAAVLSDNFFDVLAPVAAAGRMFRERELQASDAPVVVISYQFWQRQFHGDITVAGRSLTLDHRPVTLLGVLPRSFRGAYAEMVPDVWMPMSTWVALTGERGPLTDRSFRDYELYGRLQEGVRLPVARAELAAMAARLEAVYPKSNHGSRMTLAPEVESRDEGAAATGISLLGIAALVLLIACVNVASLMLARGESRTKEIATRVALGATRRRIIGQLMVENAILALAATVAAVLLGKLVLDALPKLMPQVSVTAGVDAYLSGRELVAALGVALLSLFGFGMVPALMASRVNPAQAVKQPGVPVGHRRSGMRDLLVVAQIALSLVLVVGSALLVGSVWHGMNADPGFNAHQKMLVLEITPSANSHAAQMAFAAEAQRRLDALPGVSAATVAMRVPFGMSGGGATHKVFLPEGAAGTEGSTINFDPVDDRYFAVLGTRLLTGRVIERGDLETQARVAIINHRMADSMWPGETALRRHIRLDRRDGDEYEVIGVVEDGKYNDFGERPMPYLYLPLRPADYSEFAMAVKTSVDPGTIATAVRRTLREVDKDVDIVGMLTLREHVAEALYDQRVASRFVAALGVLGLFLAAVGIYGLMAFLVQLRTREIGVRLALGARREAIFRIVIGRAALLAAVGIILGAGASVLVTPFLRSLLIDIAPSNLAAVFIGAVVLLATAVVAALGPAFRATRVDPLVALRHE